MVIQDRCPPKHSKGARTYEEGAANAETVLTRQRRSNVDPRGWTESCRARCALWSVQVIIVHHIHFLFNEGIIVQIRQSNHLVRLQKVSTFFSGRMISTPPSGLADQVTALNTAITATQNAATTQIDATNYLARQTKTVHQLRQTLHDEQLHPPLYHSRRGTQTGGSRDHGSL